MQLRARTKKSFKKINGYCRGILKISPDHLMAILYGARSEFPYREKIQKWLGTGEIKEKNIKEALKNAEYYLDKIKEIQDVYKKGPNAEALDYQKAKLLSVLWACKGYKDDHGENGFADRDDSLDICVKYHDDKDFQILHRDILERVWKFRWYYWENTKIQGNLVHRKKLKNKIDELDSKIGNN
jgi:hypothetical protein